MVKVRKDLTGRRFGRTVVLYQCEEDHIFPSGRKAARWHCLCDCGNEHDALGWDLTSGDTTSCGCYRKECELKNLAPYAFEKQYCTYDLESQEYGIGYTNKGEEFWFDKEDYDLIKDYCWYYREGYVEAVERDSNNRIKLHRLVMQVEDSNIFVDHKKHLPRKENKFDNRKSNLRLVNNMQNTWNRSLSVINTSGVTGVYYKKEFDKWFAQICCNGENYFKGYFDNKDDAIAARKQLEEKYFGEYSFDNSQQNNNRERLI